MYFLHFVKTVSNVCVDAFNIFFFIHCGPLPLRVKIRWSDGFSASRESRSMVLLFDLSASAFVARMWSTTASPRLTRCIRSIEKSILTRDSRMVLRNTSVNPHDLMSLRAVQTSGLKQTPKRVKTGSPWKNGMELVLSSTGILHQDRCFGRARIIAIGKSFIQHM